MIKPQAMPVKREILELVHSSPYRDRIETLLANANVTSYYSGSNCHGTSIWTLGLDEELHHMWEDFIKERNDVHPNDEVKLNSNKPGLITELPLHLFLKNRGRQCNPEEIDSGLIVFGYSLEERTAPFSKIEIDSGLKQLGYNLFHSAIYLGKVGGERVIFHQEDGKQPFGVTTVQQEVTRRTHSPKHTVHTKYFLIN